MERKSEVSGQIKTRVDELIALIETRGEIASTEAAQSLGLDIDTVETWARFLESTGDLRITYRGLSPIFHAIERSSIEDESEEEFPWQPIVTDIRSLLVKLERAVEAQMHEKIVVLIGKVRPLFDRFSETISLAQIDDSDRKRLRKELIALTSTITSFQKRAQNQRSSIKDFARFKKQSEDFIERLAQLIPPSISTEESTENSSEMTITRLIVELESRARFALSSGDIVEAERLREQIENLYVEGLPKRYESVRSDLKSRLFKLQEALTFQKDAKERERIRHLANSINELFANMSAAIEESDWSSFDESSARFLTYCEQFPADLTTEKQRVDARYHAIIQDAMAHRKNDDETLLRVTKESFSANTSDILSAIKEGRFNQARVLYDESKKMIDSLPEHLVLERYDLQIELASLYERYITSFKEHFDRHNRHLIKECAVSIQELGRILAQGEVERAQSAYESIVESLETIDRAYFDKRNTLRTGLVRMQRQLLEQRSRNSDTEFSVRVAVIQRRFDEGRKLIDKGNITQAESLYLDILKIYRTLPEGHETRRMALRSQIADYQHLLRKTTISHPHIESVTEHE